MSFAVICRNHQASHSQVVPLSIKSNQFGLNCYSCFLQVIPFSIAIKRMSEILLYKANECTAKLNTASEVVTQVTFLNGRLNLPIQSNQKIVVAYFGILKKHFCFVFPQVMVSRRKTVPSSTTQTMTKEIATMAPIWHFLR